MVKELIWFCDFTTFFTRDVQITDSVWQFLVELKNTSMLCCVKLDKLHLMKKKEKKNSFDPWKWNVRTKLKTNEKTEDYTKTVNMSNLISD